MSILELLRRLHQLRLWAPQCSRFLQLRLQAEYSRLHLALETSVKTDLDLQDSAATMMVWRRESYKKTAWHGRIRHNLILSNTWGWYGSRLQCRGRTCVMFLESGEPQGSPQLPSYKIPFVSICCIPASISEKTYVASLFMGAYLYLLVWCVAVNWVTISFWCAGPNPHFQLLLFRENSSKHRMI